MTTTQRLATEIATLRAAMIIRRAVRIGSTFQQECMRAMRLLRQAGVAAMEAARIVAHSICTARAVCAA